MEIMAVLSAVLFVLGGIVMLLRAVRGASSTDWNGWLFLLVLFAIAIALRFEPLTVSSFDDVRLSTFNSFLLATFRSLIVPFASATVLLMGGRWHQALLAGTIAAVFPLFVSGSLFVFGEVFLSAGVLGVAAFWQHRRWSEALVAVAAFGLASLFISAERELNVTAASLLPFAALALPARRSDASLNFGRALSGVCAVVLITTAFGVWQRESERVHAIEAKMRVRLDQNIKGRAMNSAVH